MLQKFYHHLVHKIKKIHVLVRHTHASMFLIVVSVLGGQSFLSEYRISFTYNHTYYDVQFECTFDHYFNIRDEGTTMYKSCTFGAAIPLLVVMMNIT